jgi:hypothetical protein
LFLEADKVSREATDLDLIAEEVADLAANIATMKNDLYDDDEDEGDEDEDDEDEDDEDDEDE